MKLRRCLWMLPLLSLAACGSNKDAANQASKINGKAKTSAVPIAQAQGAQLGTPMAERVAVIGLLNKRNGQTRDIELKPGQDIRVGKVVIKLRACERTAPWENYPDEGAFIQLLVFERPAGTNDAERWHQAFSGWLFKENPAANVFEHPLYDVWVKQCKMAFPGDDAPTENAAPVADPDAAAAPVAGKVAPKKQSSAPQHVAPVEEPAPSDQPDEQPTEEQTVEN